MALITMQVQMPDGGKLWAELKDNKYYTEEELNALQAFMALNYKTTFDKVYMQVACNTPKNFEGSTKL